MAVNDPSKAAQNQRKYLENMAAGTTSSGGKANAGQISWAKAQLQKMPKITPTASNNAASGLTSSTSTPTTSPITQFPKTTTGSNVPRFNWDQEQSNQFSNLQNIINTPFSYNPETDPGYQAQRQLAQLRAADATRNTLEAQNEKGLLTSSLTNSQLGQIQQRAEQEALAYIPEYRQQAYGQYQDRIANAASMLGYASDFGNTAFNRGITEAGLTGSYMSSEARSIGDQILDLKRQAEAKGITREARDALSKQADQLRARLQSLGYDPSSLGANVNAATATGNLPKLGITTLAAQNQQFNQDITSRNQDLNETVTMAELTGFMPDGTPTNAYQQQQLQNLWTVADATGVIPNELADLYGIPRGTPTRAAKEAAQQLAISRQNANTSSASAGNAAANANFNRLMDIWAATGKAPSGLESFGITPGSDYRPYSMDQNASALSDKESTDNYNGLYDDFNSAALSTEAKKRGVTEKELARTLLSQNKAFLNDSDYNKLNNWINENL